MRTIIEPFRIKVVEAIRVPTAEEREKIIRLRFESSAALQGCSAAVWQA